MLEIIWPPAGPRKAIALSVTIAVKCAFRNFPISSGHLRSQAYVFEIRITHRGQSGILFHARLHIAFSNDALSQVTKILFS